DGIGLVFRRARTVYHAGPGVARRQRCREAACGVAAARTGEMGIGIQPVSETPALEHADEDYDEEDDVQEVDEPAAEGGDEREEQREDEQDQDDGCQRVARHGGLRVVGSWATPAIGARCGAAASGYIVTAAGTLRVPATCSVGLLASGRVYPGRASKTAG